MKTKRTLFICLSIVIIFAAAVTVIAIGEHITKSTDSKNAFLELS